MIEAGVTAVIALVTAGAALTNRIHTRINDMDKRLDTFELRVATNFVPKQDFDTAIQKIEDHMIRIETKIDQIVLKNS